MIELRLAVILAVRYHVWKTSKRVTRNKYRKSYGASNADHIRRSLLAGEYDQ